MWQMRRGNTGFRSPGGQSRFLWLMTGAYAGGAVVALGLSLLPSLRGDHRDVGLAAFFGLLAVAHGWSAYARDRRQGRR
jgi:hypothetical protein